MDTKDILNTFLAGFLGVTLDINYSKIRLITLAINQNKMPVATFQVLIPLFRKKSNLDFYSLQYTMMLTLFYT